MTENLAAPDQKRQYSRRQFLTGGAVVAAAGAVGLAEREAQVQESVWISTEMADFHPIYEIHDQGFKESKLPSEFDAIFLEGHFTYTPFSHVTAYELQSYFEDFLDPDVYSLLVNNHKAILMGDVSAPFTRDTIIEFAKFTPVFLAIFSKAKAEITKKILEASDLTAEQIENLGLSQKPRTENRRSAVKKIITGLSFLFLGKTGLDLLNVVSLESEKKTPEVEAAFRVMQRISGLISHLEPEQVVVFYRNVLFAHNLLMSAQYFSDKLGRRPKIVYNIGAAHAGVEDFLHLGLDFCRSILASYPLDKQALIDNAGGFDSVGLVRVITIDPQTNKASEHKIHDLELQADLFPQVSHE